MTYCLDSFVCNNVREHDLKEEKKPYQFIYAFVKNEQRMSKYDFQGVHQSICDIMQDKGVNFGLLMWASGTYVFTEEAMDLNPLIVKLATGINFIGDITDKIEGLQTLNGYLGR